MFTNEPLHKPVIGKIGLQKNFNSGNRIWYKPDSTGNVGWYELGKDPSGNFCAVLDGQSYVFEFNDKIGLEDNNGTLRFYTVI